MEVGSGKACAGRAAFNYRGCVTGQEVALYVKAHFCEELTRLQSFKSKCYKEALEECFFKMDEMMQSREGQRELNQLNPDSFGENNKSYAGCTATVVLVTKTEIYCANSGDSRTVLAKGGQAKDMSKDHKPDDSEEMRRIMNAGGFVEDGRVNGMLALSRALGDFEYKSNTVLDPSQQVVTAFPEVRIEPIMADTQFILLACDGIWDVKTSQEAVTFMHKTIYKNQFGAARRSLQELSRGMELLLDDCCARDLTTSQGLGCDNMTAIIVELASGK